jgi:transmembrane sensor
MARIEAVPDQACVDQAIEWLVKMRYNQPSAPTEQGFRRWLEGHPHNALAWAQVEAMSDEFSGLPATLSRRTLDGTQRRGISRRDSLKLLGLVAAAGSLGWVGRDQLGLPALFADRHTATGEQRTYHNEDGSRVQLNTATAINQQFTAQLRTLSLVQGEVAIDTGSDPRPFRVVTRAGSLQAFNARLLVRERERGTFLAVSQGDVAFVASDGVPAKIVHSGEQLLLASNGRAVPVISHLDPWGWSEGVLSVQQMPLGEFVAEVSRYRPGLLRCASEVARLKVSGTYQLADTDQVLELIAQALPIRVDYRSRFWVNVSGA